MKRIGIGADKSVGEKDILAKENAELKQNIKVLTEKVEALIKEKDILAKENAKLKKKE